MEGKVLPAKPRSHQSQQERGRPHHRHDRNIGVVRQRHQHCAGVRNGRTTSFRDQAEIVADTQGVEQPGDRLRRRVFIEFLDVDLLQWRYRGQRFEKGPGRLGVFCDEMR